LAAGKTALLMDAPGRNGAAYGEAYTPSDARKIADSAARDIAAVMHSATKLRSNVRLEASSSAHTDDCDGFKLRNCYISGPGQRTKTSGEWFVSTSIQRTQIQETLPKLDFYFVTTRGVEEEIHNG
jgi:hypothetical protein